MGHNYKWKRTGSSSLPHVFQEDPRSEGDKCIGYPFRTRDPQPEFLEAIRQRTLDGGYDSVSDVAYRQLGVHEETPYSGFAAPHLDKFCPEMARHSCGLSDDVADPDRTEDRQTSEPPTRGGTR